MLTLPKAGEYQIKLSILAPDDAEPRNNQLTKIIRISGSATILYIGDGNSPIVSSLKAGGWSVTSSTPSLFNPTQLSKHDLIILDDIDIQALTNSDWQQINSQIRTQGTGLIVLGGPSSFGSGGYRNSLLEQALPVTSESREPLPPAAILFLLDKSGSMERENRMAIAQRAVLGSVDLLAKGDLTGLISFDIEPKMHIPLGQYPNTTTLFKQAFTFAPSGGTHLAPALSKAITLLEQQKIKQRIIMLVTDGFVEESSEFNRIIEKLAATNIDLIALSIGAQEEHNLLQQLTSINQGALLAVDEVAHLPQLMHSEVSNRRSGIQRGVIQPQIKTPLPFLQDKQMQWPLLAAHQVTKAQDQAEVYLTSPKGDPLFASHFYGAGRVTTIPGGLGDWATDLHSWNYWGTFLGGLVEWNSNHHPNPYLHIEHQIKHDKIEIQINAITADMEWINKPELTLLLLDPAGRASRLQAKLVAPGHYQLTLPAHLTGRYQITAQHGNQSTQHSFIYQPLTEYAPSTQSVTYMESAVQSKTLLPWHPESIQSHLRQINKEHSLRPLVLALALFVYLVTLFLERNIDLRLWRNSHVTKQ